MFFWVVQLLIAAPNQQMWFLVFLKYPKIPVLASKIKMFPKLLYNFKNVMIEVKLLNLHIVKKKNCKPATSEILFHFENSQSFWRFFKIWPHIRGYR